MRTSVLDPRGFPLCVQPDGRTGLVEFVQEHREWIDERLADHGAVLLRGFEPGDFAEAVTGLAGRLLDYVHGNSPRTKVSSANVYTSTEYPPEFTIPLHNEMSYAARWPRRLYLHCVVAPATGGRTPIAASREILRRIPADIRDRFTRKRLLYLQQLHGGAGLGRSWQDTYETDDKAAVERHLREFDVDFAWTGNGGLRTRQLRDATTIHPDLGEEVWFNQADQWHWSGAGPGLGKDLLDVFEEDELPTACLHGDGSPLAPADLAEIRQAGRDSAVAFDWHAGDLFVIDNVRLAHSREAFSGPRRILLAMS
jgi:hypothetical protein